MTEWVGLGCGAFEGSNVKCLCLGEALFDDCREKEGESANKARLRRSTTLNPIGELR